jgi:ribosomal RNA-processing protein 9
MPDSFFAASKPRKRKRSTSGHDGNSGAVGTSKKFARRDGKPGGNRNAVKVHGIQKKKGKKADEELDSDQTNEEDGGIDDLDLRHGSDLGQEASGDEDEDETPAEKRLRLAQLYLESVKEGLGASRCNPVIVREN